MKKYTLFGVVCATLALSSCVKETFTCVCTEQAGNSKSQTVYTEERYYEMPAKKACKKHETTTDRVSVRCNLK